MNNEEIEFFWLRQPGPNNTLKGSSRLLKHPYQGDADVFEKAKDIPGSVIVQYVKGQGQLGKWFLIEESIDQLPTVTAPQAAPAPPPVQGTPQSFDLFKLQMEIESMKSQNARAVDVSWLQAENSRLHQELTRSQGEALERERAAYARGRDDFERERDDAPIDAGLSLKEFLPLLEKMKGPPSAPPSVPVVQAPPPPVELRDLMALALSGTIQPKQLPGIIIRIMGRGAFDEIVENKIAILAALGTDPELAALKNGKTPEIIKGLNAVLVPHG